MTADDLSLNKARKPSIGDIVIYVSSVTRPRPAIITEVLDAEKGVVSLSVFTTNGAEPRVDVVHSPAAHVGCWMWKPEA